jgi:phage baseplate assembly protein W
MVDRFGTGLARPFRYAPGGFVTESGPVKVLSTVEALLGIDIGSVPWRCSLGTRQGRLRHSNNNANLRQLARIDAADALRRWEPRFRLRRVDVAPVAEGSRNKYDLTIFGEIAGLPGKIESIRTYI